MKQDMLYYEQNLPEMYKGQPVGLAKGMAFHESQSLFMEMQVGRSREFTEFLAKLLRDEFAFKSEEYSAASLYRKITRVTPDFIRVDADEVTYPMHVILRFEIEEMLINGDLNLDELPSCWDSKMQEYLGVKPISFSNGSRYSLVTRKFRLLSRLYKRCNYRINGDEKSKRDTFKYKR